MATPKIDLVIHGGHIVTASGTYVSGLAVDGGKIVAIGQDQVLPPAERYIDVSGKYVLPGPIECHIHLGPECDDWTVGSVAAAHAGVTSVIAFGLPDDDTDEALPDAVRRLTGEASQRSVLDFGLHLILHHRPIVLRGIPDAVRMGVTSYKMFMSYKKRPYVMCPDSFICQAMDVVAAQGGVVQLHCENGDILDYLEAKFIREGRIHPTDFPPACPDWAEEEAINRAVRMAAFTRCPLYIVHLSTQLGLERIKQAQALGQPVWAETCPHYLLLTDAEMERWGPLAKIGPPLRRAAGPDRDALWHGLERGQIATVASDHAPSPKLSKEGGWTNIFVASDGRPVPFGSPSVETTVPLMYSEGVVKRGLPLTWMARVLSENPARIFGLYPRKGAIQIGADADLLILDPTQEMLIRAADHHSKAGWSLYEGWTLRGRPWMTLLRGRVLLNRGTLEQEPGYGTYLPRTQPMPPLGGPIGP